MPQPPRVGHRPLPGTPVLMAVLTAESGFVEGTAYTPEGSCYIEDPAVLQDPRCRGPEKEAEGEQQVQPCPSHQGH
jgi:hypothetical protein